MSPRHNLRSKNDENSSLESGSVSTRNLIKPNVNGVFLK